MATVSTGGLNITQHLYQLNHILDQATFAAIEGTEPVGSEKEVREQIALSHQILSKTRFLLNTMCPINRLPVELLATIFSQVQIPDPWSSFPPVTGLSFKNFYSWLTVTAVCHHWRRTALAEPSLWARIYVPSSKGNFKDLMLKRARTYPISLRQGLHPTDPAHAQDGTLLFASQYCAQLKILDLERQTFMPTDDPSHFWKIFDYRFPLIEEVHLNLQFNDPEPVSSSLHRMLQDSRHSLRRLSLNHLVWPMGISNLPHLTHLSLDNLAQGPEGLGSTFSIFLDALQNSPKLQFLSMHNAVPISAHANSNSVDDRIVHLPCLRRIEISWDWGPEYRMSCLLLRHLKVVHGAEVFLYVLRGMIFMGVPEPSRNYLDFLECVVAHLPSKNYLDRVSTVQLCDSLAPAVLLRGETMCVQSIANYDAHNTIQRFAPFMPNARTLIFDKPTTHDPRDFLVFYPPSRFSTLQFLYWTPFVYLVEALTHPMVNTVFPSPPNEIYLPPWSLLKEYAHSYFSLTALDEYRDKEVCVIDRSHLDQPPLRLFFGQVAKPPFAGSLDKMLRFH